MSGEIRSIAVARGDVTAAFEHDLRREGRAVLRVTPPFHGRMRARVHVEGEAEYTGDPAPIHVPPEALIDDGRAPDRPVVPETREAGDRVDDHYERHARALERWREAVGDAIVEEVEIETPAGRRTVGVRVVG